MVDGCKVQLRSSSDSTEVLDELAIELSNQSIESPPDDTTSPDESETNPTTPDDTTSGTDFIDSIANKVGIPKDQLLIIAGGSLAALVLLIVVVAAIKRKRH